MLLNYCLMLIKMYNYVKMYLINRGEKLIVSLQEQDTPVF